MKQEKATYTLFDPLLTAEQAALIPRLAAAYGGHGMYSNEAENDGIGDDRPQRFDAINNYIASYKDVPKDKVDFSMIAARNNYFRETYAYGEEIYAPGIEPFLYHEGMMEAAREIFGRPLIEPAIVFANILVPGQELPVHTDVPEFRGANRRVLPQWLIVAMHHSGLFEEWRMPIATCVSWYHQSNGGKFVYYPDGIEGEAVPHVIKNNTAIIIDTDSYFHGVGRMDDSHHPIKPLKPGMKLHPIGETNPWDRWAVRNGDEEIDQYDWTEMRLSISWKAYCFADEADRDRWRTKAEDLSLDFILDTLIADMRARGALNGDVPPRPALADLIVATYIKFPPPQIDLVPDAFAA